MGIDRELIMKGQIFANKLFNLEVGEEIIWDTNGIYKKFRRIEWNGIWNKV